MIIGFCSESHPTAQQRVFLMSPLLSCHQQLIFSPFIVQERLGVISLWRSCLGTGGGGGLKQPGKKGLSANMVGFDHSLDHTCILATNTPLLIHFTQEELSSFLLVHSSHSAFTNCSFLGFHTDSLMRCLSPEIITPDEKRS